jgi:CRP-like cAMP-binding protein
VYTYKAGDYFGELSLLKNSLRAANIIAKVLNLI